MAVSLKERQIEALKCMLNFNTSSSTSEGPQWKVLIYDQMGRDIISPLLTIKDLRSLDVTLHLLLNSRREPIPDVPAIYFVYPSQENILNICKDFEAGLYGSYYLNFISPISRENLEAIAQTALSSDSVQQICRVFDQYTNFICLEDDFVTLWSANPEPSSFHDLNRAKATEKDIENIINSTVDGLFSIFATTGSIPVIRCPRGNASEMVATRLDAKLRDSLLDSRNSLFLSNDPTRGYGPTLGSLNDDNSGGFNISSQTGNNYSANVHIPNFSQRPLLILLDRSQDLATPLHHELSYQSLVHDIFKIRLNRVRVDLDLLKSVSPADLDKNSNYGSNKKSSKLEEYDLSSASDRLWRDLKGAAFSDVAEAIREEVTNLKDYEKRMSELKTSMGISPDTDTATASSTLTLLDDNTARLTNAISSLPQLIERKRCLDMHTNIATCLANVIKQRQLHVFAEEEDHLIAKYTPSTEESLTNLIRDTSIGNAEDKLRLLLIAALAGRGKASGGAQGSTGSTGSNSSSSVSGSGSAAMEFCLSDSELDKLKNLLQNQYPDLDLSSITYVQRLRRLPKSGLSESLRNAGGQSMFDKLVSHGSAIFLAGMRNLISRKSYLPFTRIVSQLMENKSGTEVEDYRYFDPKLHRRHDSNVARIKQPFCDAFVFIIGGGCYVEYHNLLDWIRTTCGVGGPNNAFNSGTTSDVSNGADTRMIPTNNESSLSSLVSWNGPSCSKRITYGCTDLVSPSDFLRQLTELGHDV